MHEQKKLSLFLVLGLGVVLVGVVLSGLASKTNADETTPTA